jgi:hypothetical protein
MIWTRTVMVGVSALWLTATGCEDRTSERRTAAGPTGQGGSGAEKQGQQASAQQGSTTAGQLVRASKDEVVLKPQGDPKELKLKVDSSTQVLIDGRQASASDLREGSQVRASFDASKGEPRATRIEASGGAAGTTREPGERPGGSAGTTGGLGGSSSATPGQSGGPGGGSSTSASEPGAPRGQSAEGGGTQSGK